MSRVTLDSRAVVRPKVCVEIGMRGLCKDRTSIAAHPLFRIADAFELKLPEFIPLMHDIVPKKNSVFGPYKRMLTELKESGKDIVFHHKSVIDEQNWLPLLAKSRGQDVISLLQKVGINFASFHLGGSNRKYFFRSDAATDFDKWKIAEPGDNRLFLSEFMRIFDDRLAHIQKRFRGRIAFENMPYEPHFWATEFISEPEFISEVFGSHKNISFLLDLAHAQVAANMQRKSIEKYLDLLPLERVSEIHISHPDAYHDAHNAPTKVEHELLKYVESRGAKPEYITVEFSRDNNILLNSIEELKTLIQ